MSEPLNITTKQLDFTSAVLESLNWPKDDKFIPVANAENKQLLELISSLSDKKISKAKSVENDANRVSGIKYHIGNSQQEIDQNLKLLHSIRNESQTDDHLLKLTLRDESRLGQLIGEVKKSEVDLEKLDVGTQVEIEKINKNLLELSDKIQWAKGAMNEFRTAMEDGERMHELIAKYCKDDATRAEVIESKRKIVQANVYKQREVLMSLNEEQKSLEQVLERTAQLYREAHRDRRHMIGRWKEAVNQMNQRDNDITDSEMDVERAIKRVAELELELKLQVEFLNQQIQNNKDVEREITELNAHCSGLRSTVTELRDTISLRQNELDVEKKTLYNTAQRLNNQRQKNRQEMQEKETKLALLEKEIEAFARLQEKEAKFRNKNMNAQERLRQLDEMVESEEKNMHMLHQELARFTGALFRSQQQLHSFQDNEKVMHLQSESLRSAIASILANTKVQEKELQRQSEQAYSIDFNIQIIEKRINNMKGGVNRNIELENKLLEAEATAVKRRKDLAILLVQATKSEDDMNKLTQNYKMDTLAYEKVLGCLKERQMHVEGGEKELQHQIYLIQEQRVDESILKMKIHQLEKEIRAQESKAYNLEKHRLDLNVTIKERLMDISGQRDLLLLKRKNYVDEVSQLRADIGERNVKIEALKARYDCVLELLGRNDDGTIVTATQIKVRNAQEKHMLLKEGNDLNDKVLQAEEDLKAMENTVRLMNYSNDNYRREFETYEEPNPLVTELEEVQQQYCRAVVNLRALKATYHRKLESLAKLDTQKMEFEKVMEEIQHERNEKNDILLKIHKELMDQKVKMQRADRELKMALKSFKLKINDSEILPLFEKDILAREMDERNASALQQMADFIEHNSDVGPYLKKLMCDKGLPIPFTKQKSQMSLRSNVSGAGSDYSIAISSASSKASIKSSAESSISSKKSGITPSVVMIGFDGNTSSKRASTVSAKRSGRFGK